jgi:hypothetical protein
MGHTFLSTQHLPTCTEYTIYLVHTLWVNRAPRRDTTRFTNAEGQWATENRSCTSTKVLQVANTAKRPNAPRIFIPNVLWAIRNTTKKSRWNDNNDSLTHCRILLSKESIIETGRMPIGLGFLLRKNMTFRHGQNWRRRVQWYCINGPKRGISNNGKTATAMRFTGNYLSSYLAHYGVCVRSKMSPI